jgi:hypothetical protein
VAKTKAKPAKRPAAKQKKAPAPRPTKAVKPAKPSKPSKPSLPLPPPPPPPPPMRDELDAPRDIARLLRYGERFGAKKIDVRMLPLQLPVASGSLGMCDPGAPKTFKVLDRPVGTGAFRVMLSVARDAATGKDQLAAVTIHVGRPPIAKWTVAHARGQRTPKSSEQIPRWPVTTGWLALVDAEPSPPGMVAVPEAIGVEPVDLSLTDGRHVLALPCGDGEYTAYWAVDANDKPVCLVVDFDVFTQKEWKAKPTA